VDPKLFFSDPDPALGLISNPDSDPDPACLTKVMRLYIRLSYKIFSHQLKFELQIIKILTIKKNTVIL
jgi:hypothetical protein